MRESDRHAIHRLRCKVSRRDCTLMAMMTINPFLIAMGVPLTALSFVMRLRIFRHLRMKI